MLGEDLPLLELQPETQLQYVAEGAANVVYRCSIPTPNGSSSGSIVSSIAAPSQTPKGLPRSTRGFLLRLRKALPTTVPVRASYTRFTSLIAPLFAPDHLIPQTLVKLPSSVIETGDECLRSAEQDGLRPHERRGLYLAPEEHGLLVKDMTADSVYGHDAQGKRRGQGGVVTIEFKPKWLAQSPNAPLDARRCRTCALRAMKGGDAVGRGLCPLDLVSGDRERVRRAVGIILAKEKRLRQTDISTESPLLLRDRLVDFFLDESSVLHRLRKLQTRYDPDGVLSVALFTSASSTDTKMPPIPPVTPPSSSPSYSFPSESFLVATTLRDCTLFLRIPLSPITPTSTSRDIEARLGDLDLKSPSHGKAEYWARIERRLIDEGWYTGTESMAANQPEPLETQENRHEGRRWCLG